MPLLMEEIEVNMNLLSSAELPSDAVEPEIQFSTKENKVLPKSRTSHSTPRKRQRITGKKVLTNRVPKFTKRKKYTKSKKEDTDVCKGIIEDSIQKIKPVEDTNDSSHLLPFDLSEKYNFKYEVMSGSDKHFFFLQDKYMKAFNKYYPEYLCIDFLCEIPELELNLCVFINVDGNGCCEIVSVGLIKSFDSGFLWLSEVFKKHNPNWHKIKVITCDKRANMLEVVKMVFPEKLIFVSFFHALKALKHELSNLDPEVSDQDINEMIHIFEQMVYTTDEGDYAEFLKQLKLMPPSIVTYFRKAWHQKKDSWALGHQLNSKIFLKSFNTYLFHLRKEIRPVVNTQNSIRNVIEKLYLVLERMRKEKFWKFTRVFAMKQMQSKQVHLHKFAKFLTKFATELVFEQYTNSIKVKNVRKLSYGKYACASEDVTTNACSCNFFQLFSLPCCHVFVIRKQLSLPLFAETLSSSRWIAANYQTTYLDLHNSSVSENINLQADSDDVESSRYQKYLKICSQLWLLLTECSENTSQERTQTFRNLLNVWKRGIAVNIKTSEIEHNSASNNYVPFEDVSRDYWREMYGVSLKDILDSDNDFHSVTVSSDVPNRLL